MPRFVLIESQSGRLYGDTAALAAHNRDAASAADAALMVDRAKGRAARGFGHVGKDSPNASLDAYKIPEDSGRASGEPDILALVKSKGVFVTSLISFNS